jgi:chromosome segregation ATPase
MALLQMLTLLVAMFVALVAYLQWRTNQQKFILDLFERRMAIYNELRAAVQSLSWTARASDENARKLLNALERARFIFGRDIRSYIKNLATDYSTLHILQKEIEENREEYKALRLQCADTTAIDARHKELILKGCAMSERIQSFLSQGSERFAPYVTLDQKIPSGWWPF